MPQKYLASIWLTIIVEIKTKVGYIKPVWNSVDFSTWSTYNYSNNITVDYGYVKNLVSDNVSYPVLITIAADPTVKQKMNVTCFFTVGQDSDIIEFIITPVGTNVSSFCWNSFWSFSFLALQNNTVFFFVSLLGYKWQQVCCLYWVWFHVQHHFIFWNSVWLGISSYCSYYFRTRVTGYKLCSYWKGITVYLTINLRRAAWILV